MMLRMSLALTPQQFEFIRDEATRLEISVSAVMQKLIDDTKGVKIGDRSNNRRINGEQSQPAHI